MSNRYITDRFLPDKAIDLMDEAAAKLRMEVPTPLEFVAFPPVALLFSVVICVCSEVVAGSLHVYSLAEIAAFPLILLERKASSRLYLEKYFLQNGQRLHPEIELGARSLLVDLAAIGFGVAGVTEEFVHEELSKGRLRKLATDFEIPPRSVDLCVLRDVPLTPAAQRFADFVKDSLSQRSGAPLNWEN